MTLSLLVLGTEPSGHHGLAVTDEAGANLVRYLSELSNQYD
ncbi:MAG: hypothetical protein ACKO1U_04500 [Bacteroidota bacterium]